MRFELSEEQQLLQDTLKGFLDAECPPARLRELFDSDHAHDSGLWKGLMELGLGGVHLPEEYGGAGLEALDLAVAAETLGACATPGPFLGHALAGAAIAEAGNKAQKERWLPRIASGDALATVAIAEGGGVWEPEGWKATADGSSLTGKKELVLGAEHADLIVVGTQGGGLVVVESEGAAIQVEAFAGSDRTRRLARVSFDGAACEPLAESSAVAERVRDLGLVLLSADAVGGATRCLEMSVEYAKTREQFGVSIGHFQAHKHMLANMAVEVEPARALYWYAAHAYDQVPEESTRSAAIAKAHLGDCFMQVARDAVEAHGGIGFTWESDVQIWFKRAMFDRAYLGSPAHHRERAAQLAGW